MESILLTLAIGLLAGYLGSLIMKGKGLGLILNLVVGLEVPCLVVGYLDFLASVVEVFLADNFSYHWCRHTSVDSLTCQEKIV